MESIGRDDLTYQVFLLRQVNAGGRGSVCQHLVSFIENGSWERKQRNSGKAFSF